jgi:hypothetical protein
MVSYNLNIPDGPNNPSNDQPKMKTNTNAIQTLISVDHVGFNTDGTPPNGVGGHHLQVSFDGKNAALAQTDPQSVLYTASGVASTVADMRFRNQNKIFPVNLIRAYGIVDGVAGGIVASQSINVASAIRNAAGSYTITMDASTTTTDKYAVFLAVNASSLLNIRYVITSATQFNVFAALDPTEFVFIVLQI